VRCLEDADLVERLAESRMPLTVCPLSNTKLCVFPTMADHNLPVLLDAGLCAMVNSDDPAYFGGYMNQNFIELFAALPQLTARHAYQLARNSFEASFVGEEQKRVWVHQLDAVFNAG
jgi:adenosine deaminase